MADKDDIQPQARLRAYELLGKLAGISAFEKVAENNADKSEHEAKQKLKELIDHLRSAGKLATKPIIDVSLPSLPANPLKDNET